MLGAPTLIAGLSNPIYSQYSIIFINWSLIFSASYFEFKKITLLNLNFSCLFRSKHLYDGTPPIQAWGTAVAAGPLYRPWFRSRVSCFASTTNPRQVTRSNHEFHVAARRTWKRNCLGAPGYSTNCKMDTRENVLGQWRRSVEYLQRQPPSAVWSSIQIWFIAPNASGAGDRIIGRTMTV